ncbi:MAG: hypothetical protein Q9213_001248 [Squamulea squamosa]
MRTHRRMPAIVTRIPPENMIDNTHFLFVARREPQIIYKENQYVKRTDPCDSAPTGNGTDINPDSNADFHIMDAITGGSVSLHLDRHWNRNPTYVRREKNMSMQVLSVQRRVV